MGCSLGREGVSHQGILIAAFGVRGVLPRLVIHGFKRCVEKQEASRLSGKAPMSDIGKILYLVIDLTFSTDGVEGAFTQSVPLILFGNGIGAIPLRPHVLQIGRPGQQANYLKLT
jgi:hypothetical protein